MVRTHLDTIATSHAHELLDRGATIMAASSTEHPEQSSGPATGVTTAPKKRKTRTDTAADDKKGRKKRKTADPSSDDNTTATGSTLPADEGPHPANKYGFHMLVKDQLQLGDQMKITLKAGLNPGLPNDEYVLMEYRGHVRNTTTWTLHTLPPKNNCEATGPKSFMEILQKNGIHGYSTKNFSSEAHMLRNGQDLGSITAIKQAILDKKKAALDQKKAAPAKEKAEPAQEKAAPAQEKVAPAQEKSPQSSSQDQTNVSHLNLLVSFE